MDWFTALQLSSINSVLSIQTFLWVSTLTWSHSRHGRLIPPVGQVFLFYVSSLANGCIRSIAHRWEKRSPRQNIRPQKSQSSFDIFPLCGNKCARKVLMLHHRRRMRPQFRFQSVFFCTRKNYFALLQSGFFILNQAKPLSRKAILSIPALVTCGWHHLATLVVFMPCSHTHLALLFWDKMMHYWCATLASPLSTFSFVLSLNLWFCCQGSNGNLRICIDCWWFYCLSSGLVALLSGWKYLIKQSAVSLWFTDANK